MIPLIMLCFILAGTLVCASIAASAAFLAQRDLAGVCDGAAIAAANAISRARLGATPGAGTGADLRQGVGHDIASGGTADVAAEDSGSGGDVPSDGTGTGFLPLDAAAVDRAVADYQARVLARDLPVQMAAATDGSLVTVTCRRTVQIPFGGLLGHRDGLDRMAVAYARSPLD
jgi:hypothetical protein